MAALRSRDENLLYLLTNEGEIDDEELLVFYLYSTETLFPIPHRNYPRFDVDRYSEEECIHSFRFRKAEIEHLATALRLPDRSICKNGTIAGRLEGMYIFFRRLSQSFKRYDSDVWSIEIGVKHDIQHCCCDKYCRGDRAVR